MLRAFGGAVLLAIASVPAVAQNPYDPAVRIAAQREAMGRLAFMDGVWRGPAWTVTTAGRRELTQTERIGAFLDGAIRVIEGRGYEQDGTVGFNALGVISFDPRSRTYRMSSWAMGQAGDFPLALTETGYVWEVPAGPAATIRYTATIRDGSWREVGERIVAGAAPVQIFEMNLRRVGDTAWPAGDPVPPR